MANKSETPKNMRSGAREVLGSLARGILAREAGAIHGKETEYLHRMRSRTSRLKTAVRLLGKVSGLRKRAQWLEDVDWLMDVLGGIRDLDVMLASMKEMGVRLRSEEHQSGFRHIWKVFSRRREELYRRMRKIMRTQRWKQLKARLRGLERQGQGLWIADNGDAAPLPRDLFSILMVPCLNALQKRRAPLLERVTPRRIHAFRLTIKPLRYLCEFFQPFLGKKVQKQLEFWGKCQACLGDMHDLDVLYAELQSLRLRLLLSRKSRRAASANTAARLIESIHRRHDELWRQFETLWPGLNSAAPMMKSLAGLSAIRKSKRFSLKMQ